MGADARHGEAEMSGVPLLVCCTCEQPGATLPGLPRQAAAREPAVTRAELISELAASSPHLRVEDAELIVATVFDQSPPLWLAASASSCVGLAPSQ